MSPLISTVIEQDSHGERAFDIGDDLRACEPLRLASRRCLKAIDSPSTRAGSRLAMTLADGLLLEQACPDYPQVILGWRTWYVIHTSDGFAGRATAS